MCVHTFPECIMFNKNSNCRSIIIVLYILECHINYAYFKFYSQNMYVYFSVLTPIFKIVEKKKKKTCWNCSKNVEREAFASSMSPVRSAQALCMQMKHFLTSRRHSERRVGMSKGLARRDRATKNERTFNLCQQS